MKVRYRALSTHSKAFARRSVARHFPFSGLVDPGVAEGIGIHVLTPVTALRRRTQKAPFPQPMAAAGRRYLSCRNITA